MNTIAEAYFGSRQVHWTTMSFKYSSIIGLAIQLAPKSAANNVILLGLYCFSLSTQGNISEGTSGVSLKIDGSHILNTPSLTIVVTITSDTNASI